MITRRLAIYLLSYASLVFLTCCCFADDFTDQAAKSMEQRSSIWQCRAIKQFVCTPNSCDAQNHDLDIWLDFDKKIYKRCVGSNCDGYKFKARQWGIYTIINFEREGGAYFIAINDGSDFTESITQGIWTLSGFGKCVLRHK